MTKQPKLVVVDWLDSKGVTNKWEWSDDLDPLEPSRCESVGFLLDKNASYVTIVQTLGGEQILGRLTIPAGAIRKIHHLRGAGTR